MAVSCSLGFLSEGLVLVKVCEKYLHRVFVELRARGMKYSPWLMSICQISLMSGSCSRPGTDVSAVHPWLPLPPLSSVPPFRKDAFLVFPTTTLSLHSFLLQHEVPLNLRSTRHSLYLCRSRILQSQPRSSFQPQRYLSPCEWDTVQATSRSYH